MMEDTQKERSLLDLKVEVTVYKVSCNPMISRCRQQYIDIGYARSENIDIGYPMISYLKSVQQQILP